MEPDITIVKPCCSNDKSLDQQLKEKTLQEELKKARILLDSIDIPDDIKNGLSYLDMKNDTMLSYLVDLSNVMLKKAKGKKIEGSESIERICEYRLILEKSKPIDQKLKYQLNRLLTARETDERMNLDNFDLELDNQQDDNTDDPSEDGSEDL